MRKIQYKFTNLKKAYQRLVEVANLYDGKNEIIRDSLIQRFEFTYELTHKTLQEFFEYSGITMENSFPRMIYKKAYANHLIDNDKIWINLLEDRNATSHLYSEQIANEIAHRIVTDYVEVIGKLIEKLDELI